MSGQLMVEVNLNYGFQKRFGIAQRHVCARGPRRFCFLLLPRSIVSEFKNCLFDVNIFHVFARKTTSVNVVLLLNVLGWVLPRQQITQRFVCRSKSSCIAP